MMDYTLIKSLERMKEKEEWKRKARHKGEIIKKNVTKYRSETKCE